MGSFSLGHWIIVLLIVLLLFGSSKIKNLGGDLGDAVRSFKKGMAGDEAPKLKDEKTDKPGDDAKS